jgi:hypothetical protein
MPRKNPIHPSKTKASKKNRTREFEHNGKSYNDDGFEVWNNYDHGDKEYSRSKNQRHKKDW